MTIFKTLINSEAMEAYDRSLRSFKNETATLYANANELAFEKLKAKHNPVEFADRFPSAVREILVPAVAEYFSRHGELQLPGDSKEAEVILRRQVNKLDIVMTAVYMYDNFEEVLRCCQGQNMFEAEAVKLFNNGCMVIREYNSRPNGVNSLGFTPVLQFFKRKLFSNNGTQVLSTGD